MVSCLWIRARLERYADGALDPRRAELVHAHVARCTGCLARVERQDRLRGLVQMASPVPPEPDWSTFWPGVQARIARAEPAPVTRQSWWTPLWRPLSVHPRLALGGALAAALAVFLTLWPASEGPVTTAWAGPVVVQDVGTPDPDRSVMVYSTPDHSLTVIWLFNSSDATEES
jgi:anti-sigma factor RsiW